MLFYLVRGPQCSSVLHYYTSAPRKLYNIHTAYACHYIGIVHTLRYASGSCDYRLCCVITCYMFCIKQIDCGSGSVYSVWSDDGVNKEQTRSFWV